MRKFKSKRIPILYKYFISFFIITLIPIVFMSFSVYYFYTSNEDASIKEKAYSNLTQVRYKLDYLIQNYFNVILRFSSDGELAKLLEDETGNSYVKSLIANYETKFVEPLPHMFLYRRGSRYINTSDEMVPYRQFESDISNEQNMTMIRLYSNLNSVGALKTFNLQYQFTDGIQNNKLCFLYPIPYYSTTPYASAIIMLDGRAINSIFENHIGTLNYYIFIYTPDYQLVYYNGSKAYDNINFLNLAITKIKGSGVSEFSLPELGDFVVVRSVSSDSGMIYCTVMERGKFYEKSTSIKNIFFFVTIIIFASCIVIAALFAFYYYRPVNQLIKNILLKQKDIHSDTIDEFELLRYTYNNVFDNNSKLLVEINQQRPMIIHQSLLMILQGESSRIADIDYYIKCANLNFQYKYYFVIVLKIIDISQSKEEIIDYIEQVYFNDGHGYGTELQYENSYAVILNTSNVNFYETRRQYAQYILDMIDNNLNIKMQIAVGNVYDSISKCSLSFLEAKATLFSCNASNPQIYLFENTASEKSNNSNYPNIEQILYIQSLQYGNLQVATESLEQITNCISKYYPSFLVGQCICFDTIAQVIKFAEQSKITIDVNMLKKITLFSSLNDFTVKMLELTRYLCSQILYQIGHRNAELQKNIIEYINDNFCSSSISLKSVSNEFSISASFLSRLIKEETGYSFNQYITILRLTEIKRKLRDTDYMIKDIILNTGYLDVASFCRKFKSIENITPGEYRIIARRKSVIR